MRSTSTAATSWLRRSLEAVRELEGVDLTMWLTDNGREAAVIAEPGGGELRFAPGGQ